MLTVSGAPDMDRSDAGREPALAEMRQLFDSCDAAVFVGGRLMRNRRSCPESCASSNSLERTRSTYFATATGGCARLLFEQEILPRTEVLRNGLTPDENLHLATKADCWSAARMIVEDLRELAFVRGPSPRSAPTSSI